MSDHAAHAHGAPTTPWPLVISIGILFLIPLAFIFKFVNHQPLTAFVCMVVGAPLIIMGIAGWVREAIGGAEFPEMRGLGFGAMGWFILAEALIFLPTFASYWVMRLNAAEWPPAGSIDMPSVMPLVMTVILVSSSFTIHYAEEALENGKEAVFKKLLMITMGLGFIFLMMSMYEWNHLFHEGFVISTNLYSSVFFTITGLHASHVIVGLGIFVAILLPALNGTINHVVVRTGSLYWHFVDIIWFFVVSQMYFW
jgi:cytochrome c oxidase subunit 3